MANWEQLEADVVERIRALAIMDKSFDGPPALKAKIWKNTVVPNVELLARFCANVELEDELSADPDADLSAEMPVS